MADRKRSFKVYAQQYLKMDPSNSLNYRQYFQYYDRSSTQQLQHPVNENFGAFLWSLPTSTGFNLQHKNSIVILPFYINSLIRVVPVELCGYLSQHHFINFKSSIIRIQANLINHFLRNNYGIVASCTHKESCIYTM